jgi:tetratricopeptide (TPR) repeat protein/ADP-heptose:LPS heptosyltransferase
MNFQDAVNAQNNGDLKLADKIYTKILGQQSNNFEILFNYAVLNFNLKNYIKSEELFKKAILINNNNHQIFNGYGVLLKELNRDEEAAEKFYKAIEIKNDYLNAYLNLFQVYKKYNNQEEMLKIIDKIISIKPNFPIMYHEKASILLDLEKFDEAINSIEAVFKYEKNSIENYLRLYDIYGRKKDFNKCEEISKNVISILEKKIGTNNKNSNLYYDLGIAYQKFEKLEIAKKYLKLAIKLNPSKMLYYYALAIIYSKMKEFINAKENFEQAIKIEPLNVATNILYAMLIKNEFGELKEAKKIILKFDKLFPNNINITTIKAWLLLNQGDYKNGWMAHNAHITQLKNHMKLPEAKLWKKEKLDGNLLVWSGQGLGDFIFFSKMVGLLNDYAKKILFICDKRLVPIYKRYFEKIKPEKFIIEEEYQKEKFSKHIASEMLGEFFANSVEDINNFSKNRLIPSREWDLEIDNFFDSLPKNKLNIGLSWSTLNKAEHNEKSIELDKFSEIFKKNNINLINLQFGNVKDEISSFKEKNKVEFYEYKNLNITTEIDKLMSLINKLDLVITIQNSTAHISLSIGKKTFVLLSYKPPRFYWYGPNTEKSYWYPEATLYRQKDANDDWSKILNKVGKDLDLII